MGTQTSKQDIAPPSIGCNIFRLVCDGYIRNIESELYPKLIPNSIYYICFKFYHHNNYMIYLSQDHTLNPNKIYMTDLDSIDDNGNNDNHIKCNVIPLHNDMAESLEWDIVNAGLHYEQNVPLKIDAIQSFSKSAMNINNHLFNNLDIIFKCGGRVSSSQTPNNTCMAIIFDPVNRAQGMIIH